MARGMQHESGARLRFAAQWLSILHATLSVVWVRKPALAVAHGWVLKAQLWSGKTVGDARGIEV